MDEQAKFRTALAVLSASAGQGNRKLTKEEVQSYFVDMNLKEEQYESVYAYLTSKGIQVEGVQTSCQPGKDAPLEEEDKAFLRQYQKDLKGVRKLSPEAVGLFLAKAEEGDLEAKRQLTEHYMDWVVALARPYVHQGLALQDLVQEGNLGLLIGLDTIGLREEHFTAEKHLENEIHRAIRHALAEQAGAKDIGEQVAEKLNRLTDPITELTEELGRQVTADELSMYLDMPIKELEELLRIAGENVETG